MLAVTALALMLVFSIGGKATDAAFRVGRRALAAADEQINTDSVRAVLSAFSIPAADGFEGQMAPVAGQASQISGPAVLGRDTPCGQAGPVATLTLTLTSDARSTRVACDTGADDPVVIGVIPHPGAVFQFLTREQSGWSSSWTANLDPSQLLREISEPSRRVLYVRIVDGTGRIYILARLTSGHPGWTAGAT